MATLRQSFRAQVDYLKQRADIEPVGLLVLLLLIFTSFQATAEQGLVLNGLLVVLALWLARPPRALLYAALFVGMLVFIYWYVQTVGAGAQDAQADRDDAVEIGARAMLRGHNAWTQKTVLGLELTTGPVSMFMALPFVLLFDQINLLSVSFWLLFVLTLMIGDVSRRNRSFPALIMFLLLPIVGFVHTMTWALDELYYGAILTPLLWLALDRRQYFAAGAVAAALVLSRLSYAFAVFAVGSWWLLRERRSLREIGRVAIGGIVSTSVVVALLRLIGGKAFWRRNFVATLLDQPLDSVASPALSAISELVKLLGGAKGSTLLVVALVLAASWPLRRQEHPFWHVAIALLLAHTITFSPGSPNDFIFVVLVPAMYGVAFSERSETMDGDDAARIA